ncbi:MAG: putative lipid II flippase FtsW [Armatimonadetes bacterium]|nr:putative lipid II flippase FtsW [Armatimonadota bacterium]NIM24705.1 putative lipid II flippase FtsW [Armatimonadota bacterium]NIM68585.1 putative lipid II flippase FtsW [Armatimonadota bacterium]NIM77102.1 putative lipid II flippase FtsW [Armatimonadota bacterium]NIN06779.1 putative lipid II flippase FtsW [Armatimonadota bacterium]
MSKSASFRLSRVPSGRERVSFLPSMDMGIFLPTLLLVAVGIAMVFSASYPTVLEYRDGDAWYYAKRQAGFAVAGFFALWIFSRLRLKYLRGIAYPALFVSILLLAGVLVVGRATKGAFSWYDAGPFKFQPSEMAKVALILALAKLLADYPGILSTFKGLLVPLLMGGLVCGLVLMGRDLGTTAVAFFAFLVVLFLAGARFSHLLGLSIASAGIGAFFIRMEPYRLQRIISFINPEAYADSGGYQITRSLIALGSGGLFGLGFSRSREKFFYLPTPHTDSIFAVIGEELGLIFCLAVLVLFFWLGWRGLRAATLSEDRFSSLAAAGLTSLILIQAATNLMVNVGMMPLTGLPLPFISYGGSSLLFSLIAVGIIANISRHTVEIGGVSPLRAPHLSRAANKKSR